MVIRTHPNHTSTPLPKPTTTLHLTPSKSSQPPPQIPLPQRPAGEFTHVLSQRFVRVILASGHASMALGTLLVFVLAGNKTLFKRGFARRRVCTQVALSTEKLHKLEDALPSYGRNMINTVC